ncbi:hypothetical protein SCHPADRAFT_901958 [Schizopora paradoxa]|uniref:AN1-type domain-containing protein n=1 Tax=Schizopora paradoxa TaxID=27342 RepID=A0A0H2RVF8_9AGAM|nr:hypothetical protein SCHPADRAFT_901958 [Schizopora paradoxa]
MSVGKQCSASTCQLVDFLPIKCDHCKEPFCSDHFKPESHKCSKWDSSQADRRALECFVCTKLIAIPPGADPNIRMDEHLSRECPGKPGVVKASTTPICGAPRCQKKLVAQAIECKDCKKKFCASHYHPASHKCTSAPVASGSQSVLSKMTSVKSAAALAALERVKNSKPMGSTSVKSTLFGKAKSAAATSASGASSESSSSAGPSTESKPSKPGNNPFSARDRLSLHDNSPDTPTDDATSDAALPEQCAPIPPVDAPTATPSASRPVVAHA